MFNCTELKVQVLPFPTDWYVDEQDGQDTRTCVTRKPLCFLGYSVNDTEITVSLHSISYPNNHLNLGGLAIYMLSK